MTEADEQTLRDVLFLAEHPEFQTAPCLSFKRFVGPEYLGIAEDIYPMILEQGEQMVDAYWKNGISEIILYWGIGSGKSLLASIITLYYLHILLCYENPHKALGIMGDKPIAVINMAPSQAIAKNVVFTGISNFINNSEWFSQFDIDTLGTQINFYKEPRWSRKLDTQKPNIALYCGNSKESTPIGLNVYAWLVDEFAFFMDSEEKNNAKDVRDMLKNRQASRFGLNAGAEITISSARYENDTMDSLYKEKKALHMKEVFCTKYSTWEIKDKSKMSGETFEFVAKRDEEGNPLETWTVPIDFRRSAIANPEKFMRDFACVPSLALEPFDRDAQVIVRNVNKKRENPLNPDGTFKDSFKATHNKPCYFHIDLAKNKDSCGIAVGHRDGMEEIVNEEGQTEKIPRVVADLIMRITAPKGGEIMFSEVRQVLYSMRERGFNIKGGTFDGWQSIDSVQILNKKGIKAETFSVDRTTEAYDTLKALLHQDMIDYYVYPVRLENGDTVNILEKEYMSLELIKGKKVDHPEDGSKDVTDAFAGMVRNVVKNETKEVRFYG